MKGNIHYLAEISSQIDAIPDDSILSRTLVEEGGFKTMLFGFAPRAGALPAHRLSAGCDPLPGRGSQPDSGRGAAADRSSLKQI